MKVSLCSVLGTRFTKTGVIAAINISILSEVHDVEHGLIPRYYISHAPLLYLKCCILARCIIAAGNLWPRSRFALGRCHGSQILSNPLSPFVLLEKEAVSQNVPCIRIDPHARVAVYGGQRALSHVPSPSQH